MDLYLNTFKEMISLRGLTAHTLTAYCTYIRAYLTFLEETLHKRPEDVSWQELRDYVRFIRQQRSLSDRTVNCAISQLRFFTIYVLHRPWDGTQLPMRKFDTFLPYVPSRAEVANCLLSVPDLKERAMLTLLYSSGLRVGEVCSLRYGDIERKQMRVLVRHGKNRCSRYAVLSAVALSLLTEYWYACGRPKEWLFPGSRRPGFPYSTTSFINRFTAYRRRLSWDPRLTCHSFRHAFGTHLYEDGTDLLTIKALLGHKSLQSTAVYVHLSIGTPGTAVSPLDRMGGGCRAF